MADDCEFCEEPVRPYTPEEFAAAEQAGFPGDTGTVLARLAATAKRGLELLPIAEERRAALLEAWAARAGREVTPEDCDRAVATWFGTGLDHASEADCEGAWEGMHDVLSQFARGGRAGEFARGGTEAPTLKERLLRLADAVHHGHPLLAVNMRDAARFYRRGPDE